MMTFEDVTSNLELESSYNTLIAVQKETLDNLTEGVVVYGGDGRLKLSNPAFMTQWKLNPEETEGQPHITKLANRMCLLFDSDKQEEKKETIISHALERKIQEGRIARIDGSLLEFTTVPLPDGGVLVSYFDITDSVKVENALREKNIALEEAEQIKTDFLANVSYQLRTPLNAIMGFAEILNNQYFGKLNDKQKEYTTDIQYAGEKLVGLIDDILDLSTIEAGYLDLHMTSFDVKNTLSGLFDICQQWAQKENIKTSLDCPDDIGNLIADERRLKQILLNLLHNAIGFTPEKGEINLIARRDDHYFHFTVSDTGIGISQQDLERVFEPFERIISEQRADMSANALSRGAGLGLSLVKNIAELHGGKVEITSEQNQGTTVTVSLPVIPLQEPDL
jgi:signal transduction histidine kinase